MTSGTFIKRGTVILAIFITAISCASQKRDDDLLLCCEFETKVGAEMSTRLPLKKGDCNWDIRVESPGEMVFTSSNRLVVLLHHTCSEGVGPLRTLDIAYAIDTSTGQVVSQRSWMDKSHDGSIHLYYAGENRALVFLGLKYLALVGGDLAVLKKRALEHKASDCTVTQDGHEALISRSMPENMSMAFERQEWISTVTLNPIITEKVPVASGRIKISRDEVYFSPKYPARGESIPATWTSSDPLVVPSEPFIKVRKKGESSSRLLRNGCYGMLAAVSKTRVLVKRFPATIIGMDSSGQTLYEKSYSKHEDIGGFTQASGSDRVAFSYGHIIAVPFRWKAQNTVVVVDLLSGRSLLELPISTGSFRSGNLESWPVPVVALSPDGRHLAVLNGLVLKIFAVQ